jgi:hypothetical protein
MRNSKASAKQREGKKLTSFRIHWNPRSRDVKNLHKRHIKNIFSSSFKKKAPRLTLHRVFVVKVKCLFKYFFLSRSMSMNDSFALARNALQALTHDFFFAITLALLMANKRIVVWCMCHIDCLGVVHNEIKKVSSECW